MWIAILVICIVLVVILGILLIFGNYLYNVAINPKTPKDLVFGGKQEITPEQVEREGFTLNWMNEHDMQDTYIISTYKELKLHAYEIQKEEFTHNWAICMHGYTSNGLDMVNRTIPLFDFGFNLLVPDQRGHASSQGDYIGMGWDEREDVKDWIEYILQKDKEANIILYGVSMGAATVMCTVGEELPNNVKLAIEDCGYTSMWDIFAVKLKTIFHAPVFILHFASLICRIRAGYGLRVGSCVEQLKKAKIPMLFIHGEEDMFVPFYMLDKVYEVPNVPKEKMTVAGAKHACSSKVEPERYWNTVREFIQKNKGVC